MLAVDADQGPMELLYRDLREERNEQILTLTMNLADPSPGLGWRGLERKSLPERGKPDLVLALALVHHVAISANVPVKEFIDWLASLDTALVIEFPTREDPMVKKLLAPKRDGLHPDYELGFFERTLKEAFEVERSERLESGTRVLYYARPKGDDAGDSEGGRLGLPEPRRPLDLRRSAAALRPPEGQPGVLRRPRLVRLRHRQLLGPAGGAAAGCSCWGSSCCSG